MRLLSRIWWGRPVDVCWHRLWLTQCGRCRAAERVAGLLAEFVSPPSTAERVAATVRAKRAAEDRQDRAPYLCKACAVGTYTPQCPHCRGWCMARTLGLHEVDVLDRGGGAA